MTYIDPQVTPPPYDVFQIHKSEINAALRVCLPITVTSVNGDGTVDVKPAIKQMSPQVGTSAGLASDYPTLQNCPVHVAQGSGVGAVFPPKIGDTGIIVFADRCLDAWKINGTAAPLPSYRMHDISDGIVYIGVNVLTKPLVASLNSGTGGICETRATAPGVGARVAVNPLTHKINIATGAAGVNSLLLALTTLNTALSALIVNTSTGVITPASVAAIAVAQAQIAAVLE